MFSSKFTFISRLVLQILFLLMIEAYIFRYVSQQTVVTLNKLDLPNLEKTIWIITNLYY